MRFLIRDRVCGHTVMNAAIHVHAQRQARLIDTAGFPTQVEEWEDCDGAPDGVGCARCVARIHATLVVMYRDQVAQAAIAASIDPFLLVSKFEGIRRLNPCMPVSKVASIVVASWLPFLAGSGQTVHTPCADDMDPATFPRPGTPRAT